MKYLGVASLPESQRNIRNSSGTMINYISACRIHSLKKIHVLWVGKMKQAVNEGPVSRRPPTQAPRLQPATDSQPCCNVTYAR